MSEKETLAHAGAQAKAPPSVVSDAGEHTITYAHPTSHEAARLGKSAGGCYVYSALGVEFGFDFKADARLLAKQRGTSPSRWSIDRH